ncbi:MAG: hypothetical protein WD801_15810 [Gemmatimonadaceae bacterium]
MADEQTFDVLLNEFRRVGVDPDTFSAMLAIRPEDALRALRALPDAAGPSAFLRQLRSDGVSVPMAGQGPDAKPLAKAERQRRNKSA